MPAIGAAVGWIYRAGGREPTIRKEFHEGLVALERRVEAKIETSEKGVESKLEELVKQFHDSFAALRQKINDVENHSVTKDEFNEFRKEHREDLQALRKDNREDFADIKRDVAQILGKHRAG